MDEYKQITDFEKYAIYQIGYVMNLKTGRIIKHSMNRGYPQVHLSDNKKKKCFRIHTLVALAFVPNPEGYKTVNHLDGIKTNNNPSNLEWCSYSQNKEHAVKNGLIAKGANHGMAKLSLSDINHIKTNCAAMTCQLVADQFNVTKSTISRIRKGLIWKQD